MSAAPAAVADRGGTPAATPAFAGIVALLNQAVVAKDIQASPGLGNINPMLYSLAQNSSTVFHDVTVGNTDVPCAAGTPDCSASGMLGYSAASRALIRVTPSQIPENLVPATYNQQMADRIRLLWQSVVSRGSLSELIQRPNLNLYKSERNHKPLEDVIEKMKSEDIRIEIFGINKSGGKPSSAFAVSFHYPDPIVAQKTTSALVDKLVDAKPVCGPKR